MDLSWKTIRKVMYAVCICILLSWCLNNLDTVRKGLLFLRGILMPFIIGSVMAFIINVPMRPIEDMLKRGYAALRSGKPRERAASAMQAHVQTLPQEAESVQQPAHQKDAAQPETPQQHVQTSTQRAESAPQQHVQTLPQRAAQPETPQASISKQASEPQPPKTLLRIAALLLTLVGVLLVVFVVFSIVLPELYRTFAQLFSQIPIAARHIYLWLDQTSRSIPGGYLEQGLNYLSGLDWASISRQAITMIKNVLSGIAFSGIGVISSVVGTVTSFGIGIIFSIYLLMQKEMLAGQGKQLLYAYLPRRAAERTVFVLRLTAQTFSRFVRGQCVEAVILSCMFFVSMSLFRMPYTLLVSVVICVTALIPVLGSFIGCAVGIVLIAIVNPMQALAFFVLFMVLQQIEGNLIYPHVVGSSIGLPGIWTLVAVTIGGGLMGIAGMLIFIPLSSVLYQLLKMHTKHTLEKKGITAADMR